jgi:uncharacterized membrane protein HdeD (DUF308 family)
MAKTKTLLTRSNPFRSELAWWAVAAIGAIALAVGIYILRAPASANRNIVFLIGAFLLVNGLGYALAGLKARSRVDPMMAFLLVRAGIGIATGLIVVINRFADFMGLDPARVVNGIGLVGVGAVTVIGMVMTRDDLGIRVGSIVGALALSVWGIVILVQVSNDSSSNDMLGWIAVVIGAVYLAIAWLRWRREASLATARVGVMATRRT